MPDWRPSLLAGVLALAAAMPLAALPDAAAQRIQAGQTALGRGDGIAAEAELDRAGEAGASRAEVAAAMGEALILQGELRRARQWLGPGEFAKGSEAYGWRMLGWLERLDGHLPDAGRALDKALALAPKDSLVWVEIGRLRYAGGEQLQAIAAADRALALGPDNVRALEFRAQLLRDSQGWEPALALYEKALEIAPDDVSALGGYAASLGELGRAKDMLAVTRHMIAVAPQNPYGWYLQAVLVARGGNVDLARGLLARAGSRLEEVPAAIELAGVLELEAGNANVALGHLSRLAERQPANPRVGLLLARALYEAGDYDQLFARFDQAAQRPDAPAYLLALLGRAYEDAGDRAAAAVLLDRASAASVPALMPIPEVDPPGVLAVRFAADPGNPGAAVPYVRALLASRNLAGARDAANRFYRIHPGSADAMSLAGDTALASGSPNAALEFYRGSAQVRFPDNLLLRIGEAYDRSGNGIGAQPLAARYLAGWPGSRLATRLAASHSAALGDWHGARLLLESLRDRDGDRDVRLMADLSLAQLRDDDAEAALATATHAYKLQRSSPVAAQALGMILTELGKDPGTARQLLEKVRRIGGDNPLLRQSLDKLAKG